MPHQRQYQAARTAFMRVAEKLSIPILMLAALAPRAAAQQLTPQEVKAAIDAGVRYLKDRQLADGTWPDMSHPGGVTALATLALLNAQVPANDATVSRALAALERVPNQATYVVSLKAAVFATADPDKYRQEIQTAADWLVKAQLTSGQWSYGSLDIRNFVGMGDNSNSQFALLGLHEAARAGAVIPKYVWDKAEKHWLRTQCADGGWHYVGRQAAGYGSMTAAGVASLIICGNQVNQAQEDGYQNGAAHKCGVYKQHKAITAGLNWLAENYSVLRNPKGTSWHYYWLYAAERVGILSGLKYFGEHDWYREGAEYLVNNQDGALGGMMRGGSWNRQVTDTAFAILFLAKGRRPVLINKLKWSDGDEWNPDRHDCENLVAWLGDRLGEPVSWQVMSLDAPVEEWLVAPILYVTGHEFPAFKEAHEEKMRRFVEGGGTLFFESCCSKKAYRLGFEKFIARVFPDHPLSDLNADHPVWTSLFKLKPAQWPLKGVDLGCRTSVIFSPRDLSCLWEQGDVPRLSEAAYQLGANIAAYATGREPLRDKLERIVLPDRKERPADWVPPRDALQIAQLSHSGDWKPDPWAMPNFAEYLRKSANIDVVAQPVFLRADDKRLLDHPIAYMTGHYAFDFTGSERIALKRYLQRGGFVFADACCGREAFAKSFEALANGLFPEAKLRPISSEHPILAGEPGYKLERVEYRPAVKKEKPNLKMPVLLGLEVDGRLMIVFSPYGLGCGLEDHQCYNCRGVAPADARKMATNVIVYALTN